MKTTPGGDPTKLYIKKDANGKATKTQREAKLLVKVMREEHPDNFDDDANDLHNRPGGSGDCIWIGARKAGILRGGRTRRSAWCPKRRALAAAM